jgi:hypothetical protein
LADSAEIIGSHVDKNIPPPATVMALPTKQRRSQRLFLQVAVVVEGQLPNKSEFSEAAKTIVVNAHGALVGLTVPLEPGQIVMLRNVQTKGSQESTVKLVTPGDSGKFNTAVEFTTPSPSFWQISFPPEDWSRTIPDPDVKL